MDGLSGEEVTFLFTDVERSTKLWEQDAEAMRRTLAGHDALLRRAVEAHRGSVFKVIGDAFCAAFASAQDAAQAAAQRGNASSAASTTTGSNAESDPARSSASASEEDLNLPSEPAVVRSAS